MLRGDSVVHFSVALGTHTRTPRLSNSRRESKSRARDQHRPPIHHGGAAGRSGDGRADSGGRAARAIDACSSPDWPASAGGDTIVRHRWDDDPSVCPIWAEGLGSSGA
eukprot:COSAG06_NODE_4377_length_4316_cov_2.766025_3_plen_108_part_00